MLGPQLALLGEVAAGPQWLFPLWRSLFSRPYHHGHDAAVRLDNLMRTATASVSLLTLAVAAARAVSVL